MRIPTLAGHAAAAALLVASLGPASAAMTKHAVQIGAPSRVTIPNVLREQASGLRPSPALPLAMQHMLSIVDSRPRPNLKFRPNTSPGLWVSDTGFDYLVGMTSDGQTIETAINEAANDCAAPIGIKVDKSQALWVACEINESFTSGSVQEYAPGASTPTTTYVDGEDCTSSTGCKFLGEATDVATDKHHVYAANIFAANCLKSSSCNYNGNVVWWDKTKPNNPHIIYDPNIYAVIYMDASGGNLYIDGDGCISSSDCGVVLDEISNPTSKTPTITNLVAPGTIGFAGGVYASNRGTVLNVTDQIARTITQYPIPFGAATGTLGPTLANYFGYGDPVSGGFNKGDTAQADGDAYGWLDMGGVASNSWQAIPDTAFSAPEGAAFVPSDK